MATKRATAAKASPKTKKRTSAPAIDVVEAVAAPVSMLAYKGFDRDLKCRDHQFAVGGQYKIDGKVDACRRGFHACEHPLNVFNYYPPATSRYALVSLSGAMDREKGGDTKVAAAEIYIRAELQLPDLIKAAVKWVFDRAKWSEGPVATGNNEGATASGTQGAATASGYQGAATASGTQGAATASGTQGRARGVEGSALFLVERAESWGEPDHGKITAVWAGIVGQDGIKPDTFYTLQGGKPVEAA